MEWVARRANRLMSAKGSLLGWAGANFPWWEEGMGALWGPFCEGTNSVHENSSLIT